MSSEEAVKASQHESYWSFTLLSILLPLIGLILGIVYLTKDKKLDRKLGEHMLAVSVLFCIVYGAAWGIWTVYQQSSIGNITAPVIPDSSSSDGSSSSQPAKGKVGDSLNIGGDQGLAVKLVQIIDPAHADNLLFTADKGKRLVAVKIEITNNGTSVYKDNANDNITLIGSDGQSYTFDLIRGSHIDGCTNFTNGQYTLAAGASLTGCVGSQVLNGVSVAKVQFSTNAGFVNSGVSGDIGEWSVK